MVQRFALLFKILTLVGLVIAMLIPTSMIIGVIEGRFFYQKEVVRSVTDSISGNQTLLGPVLVLPYKESIKEVVYNSHTKQNSTVVKVESKLHYFLPTELNITADANIAPRNIGIYQAQTYSTDLNFRGSFSELNYAEIDLPNVTFDEPYLVVIISDTRGITQVPLMTFAGNEIEFNPGINNSGFRNMKGIHAPIDLAMLDTKDAKFNFNIQIRGTDNLAVIPIGASSHYTLTGNWPHPNFLGTTLPTERIINEDGFTANWQSSWYANNMNEKFTNGIVLGDSICSYDINDCFVSFKTSFVETVDHYQLTERAVKYSVLFIVLTFIGFFMFEMWKQLRIHPIQYLLVGIALVLFYLVLLALSEHIGFLLAYICASLACSGLIGFYLSAVLKGIKRGGGFSITLLALYTTLYFVMNSEGNALLLGTILLFSVLGCIMVITRNIDWYQIGQRKISSNANVSDSTTNAEDHKRTETMNKIVKQ